MEPVMVLFIISAAPGRTGVTLSGDSVSYPLWYATVAKAREYARWVSRNRGCRIELRDEKGDLLEVEEVPPGTGFA